MTFEIASIQAQVDALFSLESAPVTSLEFTERVAEINRIRFLGHSYAIRTQTLLRSVIRTIEHALAIVDTVGGMIGTLQSGQLVNQGITKLVQLESELKVTTTAFQRAQSVDAIAEPWLEQSLRNINEQVWSKEP